jgi:hypothetical protein
MKSRDNSFCWPCNNLILVMLGGRCVSVHGTSMINLLQIPPCLLAPINLCQLLGSPEVNLCMFRQFLCADRQTSSARV